MKLTHKDHDAGKSQSGQIPEYEKALSAFHRGFRDELRSIVQGLPLNPEMHVADIGCGDGFYSALLAERLGAKGQLIGIDANAAYLKQAAKRQKSWESEAKVSWKKADLDGLKPFKNQFDLVWCAQSFFSFPDPKKALAQLSATLKPEGLLAVLENDSLHQCLLPWPGDMELTLRYAEFQAFTQESSHPQKFYLGRRFPQLFAEAGLGTLQFRTQAIDRRAPISKNVSTFVDEHLKALYGRIGPFLEPAFLRKVKAYVVEMKESPYFTLSWVNVLIVGKKAGKS